MKLINSYLSKNILQPTATIIVILSIIILLTQSLKYIDYMVLYGISGTTFIYLSILLLPSILFITIPICLFIAIIYSLNKLGSHRELNILKGFGIDNFSISKPILMVALLITFLHYFISLYGMPMINRQFKDLTSQLKGNSITFFLQEKVFTHPTDYLTFYIKNKTTETKFKDIFFQDNSSETPFIIIAEEGELITKNNQVFLNLTKGNRQTINKQGERNTLYFDTLFYKLSSNNYINGVRETTIQEKHLSELLFPDPATETALKKRMLSEASHRLTWPLYNIIFTIIAIIALLQGQYNRSGKTKRIILFSIIAGAIAIASNSLINLSATYSFVIILSYLFTFAILSLLCYFLFYKES
jgi:lipopolysaccharide export system permease protein